MNAMQHDSHDRAESACVSRVVRLRAATEADVNLLRHWDRQPHVLLSDPNDDWEWEVELIRSPVWREQLIAELDASAESAARPIGFVQIIDPALEETHYWGNVSECLRAIDIWIGEAADLGRGYGTAMMRLALERCFADASVRAVLVDPLTSNTRSHRFYERLGFRFLARRRFGADECCVYRLERAAYARGDAHQAAISGAASPLPGQLIRSAVRRLDER